MTSYSWAFVKLIDPTKPLGYGLISPLQSIAMKNLRSGQQSLPGDGRGDELHEALNDAS